MIRDSFKAAVFALLVLNTGIYLASGSFSEGLDSVAWLTLLALFQLETGLGGVLRAGPAITAVHAIRLVAIAAVGAAAAGYFYDGEWLGAYDAALWLVAFATIEMNVLEAARRAAASRVPSGNPA